MSANQTDKSVGKAIGDAGLENLWWGGTIFLGTIAALVFKESWWSAIALLVMGVVIAPPVFAAILEKIKLRDAFHARFPIVLLTLVGSTYLLFAHTDLIRIQQEAATAAKITEQARQDRIAREAREKARIDVIISDFTANRDMILADLEAAISAKDLAKGDAIVSVYHANIKDDKLLQLVSKFQEVSAQAKRDQRISTLLSQSKNLQVHQYTDAIKIYTELSSLDPQNPSYKKTLDRFTKAKTDSDELARKAAAAAEEKAKRTKKIEAQFSGWDGSHYTFERMIKNAMNDPDSYDHIETRYKDLGSNVRVYTKFRGKNAFGGLVVNTKIADFDLNGNFIREVE